jgi:hypothetical protein
MFTEIEIIRNRKMLAIPPQCTVTLLTVILTAAWMPPVRSEELT